MPHFKETYISIEAFANLQSVMCPYEGFVVGLGYAYAGTDSINPPNLNGFYNPGNVPPALNRFTLLRNQYVDNSPEMIERSMNGIASQSVKIHTVQQGDTLSEIAQQYGVSVDDLVRWNKLGSQNEIIKAGQKLVVSEKSKNFSGNKDSVSSQNYMQRSEAVSIQDQVNIHAILEKYNEYCKNVNDFADPLVQLLNILTKGEIAWLKKAGSVLKWIGFGNIAVKFGLTIDAFHTGNPWGKHAYNTVSGIVGQIGPYGAGVAKATDSYVDAAEYLNRLVNWVNTELPKKITSQIIVGR